MQEVNNEDFVCLDCRIEEFIDDSLGMQDQFKDILQDCVLEEELFPVAEAIEDSFRILKRAKIKLLQAQGYRVFRIADTIEYIPPTEKLEL